jgi:hypothetical protein
MALLFDAPAPRAPRFYCGVAFRFFRGGLLTVDEPVSSKGGAFSWGADFSSLWVIYPQRWTKKFIS